MALHGEDAGDGAAGLPEEVDLALAEPLRRYLVSSIVSATACSVVIRAGSKAGYDLPIPRWSRLTTTKSFASIPSVGRESARSLWPGPPGVLRSAGLSGLHARISIHWSAPPSLTFSSEAMLQRTTFPSASRIGGTLAGHATRTASATSPSAAVAVQPRRTWRPTRRRVGGACAASRASAAP